jgi:hypothetical protein
MRKLLLLLFLFCSVSASAQYHSIFTGVQIDTGVARATRAIGVSDTTGHARDFLHGDGTWGTFPSVIGIACSDETTALTASTTVAKVTFRMPYAMTVVAVRASVTTAPTGATILVDIHESGTTILSTKIMIDVSEFTSTTATTAYVISDASLADDAEMTIYVDQIGSTIAGAGLKVWIIGTRSL